MVDKKLIDGPNPNERGKWWIPLVMLGQVSAILCIMLSFKVLFVGGFGHPSKWKKSFSLMNALICFELVELCASYDDI